MPARRPSPDTRAIIAAIEGASATAKVVADSVAKELVLHTQHDDERFADLTKLVESVALDVKSLLGSRSYVRGAWKGVTVAAVVASSLVTAVHAYWDSFLALVRGH